MDFTVGNILSSKQRLNICVYVLVATLVVCVSSKPTMGDNSLIDDTKIGEKTDLRKLLTLFILPRLKLEEVFDSGNEFISDNNYQDSSRIKRKTFAGMDNFDIMTATLDRQQHRRPTMMSVHRVAMNRLQYLMRQQGRRRK